MIYGKLLETELTVFEFILIEITQNITFGYQKFMFHVCVPVNYCDL